MKADCHGIISELIYGKMIVADSPGYDYSGIDTYDGGIRIGIEKFAV